MHPACSARDRSDGRTNTGGRGAPLWASPRVATVEGPRCFLSEFRRKRSKPESMSPWIPGLDWAFRSGRHRVSVARQGRRGPSGGRPRRGWRRRRDRQNQSPKIAKHVLEIQRKRIARTQPLSKILSDPASQDRQVTPDLETQSMNIGDLLRKVKQLRN